MLKQISNFKPRQRRGKFQACPATGGISNTAFTLIELLAVIAIIALLAGLLLAAVNAARKRAHIASAKAEVRELAKAWKSYWMIYGEWPFGNVEREMDAAAMQKLQGGNPQKIKFMDLGSEVTTEGFKDPWGEFYRVRFDKTITPGKDYYETTVYFPNKKRFEYE